MDKTADILRVRITKDAVEDYHTLFGRFKKTEMISELYFFIKKHQEAGYLKIQEKLALNYDGNVSIMLERKKSNNWVVIEFLKAECTENVDNLLVQCE